jgi:hypothetical protein
LHRNCLIKPVVERNIKGREDEEGDISSYFMTGGEREDTCI